MDHLLSDADFNLFSKLIYDHSGIHFSEMNRSILETRLQERLRLTKHPNITEYYHHLLINPEELKLLLDSVTTNLTKFFRHSVQFDTLKYYVIPELVNYKRRQKDNVFRVWSAGCATGEEPYSIAMVLKERLPAEFEIKITASDLSLKSLLVAQEGFYPENKLEGVPPHYLGLYFEKKNSGYKIKDELKSLIRFDYHNLKYESGLKGIDILFCRNVIIYFDENAQRAVINRFWKSMADYSFLFLGHSESLFGMNTEFEFVKTEWSIIYRKQQGLGVKNNG